MCKAMNYGSMGEREKQLVVSEVSSANCLRCDVLEARVAGVLHR